MLSFPDLPMLHWGRSRPLCQLLLCFYLWCSSSISLPWSSSSHSPVVLLNGIRGGQLVNMVLMEFKLNQWPFYMSGHMVKTSLLFVGQSLCNKDKTLRGKKHLCDVTTSPDIFFIEIMKESKIHFFCAISIICNTLVISCCGQQWH